MAFDGTDPCWIPDLPMGVKRKPRLNIAKFGDGYEQRMADGINFIDSEYTLSWEAREELVIMAMDDFLSATTPRAFEFQHPVTKQIIKVFCDEWDLNWNFKHKPAGKSDRIHYGNLTATFRIAYGEAIT